MPPRQHGLECPARRRVGPVPTPPAQIQRTRTQSTKVGSPQLAESDVEKTAEQNGQHPPLFPRESLAENSTINLQCPDWTTDATTSGANAPSQRSMGQSAKETPKKSKTKSSSIPCVPMRSGAPRAEHKRGNFLHESRQDANGAASSAGNGAEREKDDEEVENEILEHPLCPYAFRCSKS